MQFINYYIQTLRHYFFKKGNHKQVNKKEKRKRNFLHIKSFAAKFSNEDIKISDNT